MGLKRTIRIWQFDDGYQVGCLIKPGEGAESGGMYVSDPIKKLDFDALIEKLKWIHEHKDESLKPD